ncbi:hypothetical protein [Burkholderia vietnamiensis]|uniref:hypothetical protein n=1 Tax=Burkholderia vietnamiensis TaxID=60552 RepID=UPI0018C89973|nr:hypothetical protein [Burkholderia vietnamiensis]
MRGTQEPKALALFCHAHMSEVVEMIAEMDLEFRNLDHDELAKWTDDNAAGRYKAVTGENEPHRILWRLGFLRESSHEQEGNQVFPGSPGARSASGT